MAQNYSLPKPTEPFLDQFDKVSVPWYNYLRTRFGDGAAGEIIASIEAQIADLIARVEALEEGDSAIISGPESVRVVGTLAGGLVQLTLEGDDRSPPPTYYYGTNAVEVKGFHPVADTIIQSDGITLTVNADGTTNIAHADTSSVADISANFTGGTVPGEISFTFDQFGHVLTRTITGRTLDHNDTGALQGGSATERYHFTEAEHTGLLPWAVEDPADYALITQTITNGDTTHAPSGDAVFDALASAGTVTSVDLSMPATFNVSGNPITSSGTLSVLWASQPANYVLSGPTGGAPTTPSFRQLATQDISGLASGTYTPTLGNVANVDASTSYLWQYMRVGNVVTVSGRIDIDATTNGVLTQINFSLPLTIGNFTTTQQLAGVASSRTQSAQLLSINGNVVGRMEFMATSTVNTGYFLTFTYQIIP